MTKEKKIELIDKWIKAGIRMSDAIEKVCDAMMIQPESPIHSEPWHLFDAYTDTLAEIIGDDGSILMDWFAFECKFGRDAKTMRFANGEKLLVVGASDLYAAIDSDEDGNRKWESTNN